MYVCVIVISKPNIHVFGFGFPPSSTFRFSINSMCQAIFSGHRFPSANNVLLTDVSGYLAVLFFVPSDHSLDGLDDPVCVGRIQLIKPIYHCRYMRRSVSDG